MTLIQKVLACSVLTGAGIAGYKYLNQKPKTFKPVKVITDNSHMPKIIMNPLSLKKQKILRILKNFLKRTTLSQAQVLLHSNVVN